MFADILDEKPRAKKDKHHKQETAMVVPAVVMVPKQGEDAGVEGETKTKKKKHQRDRQQQRKKEGLQQERTHENGDNVEKHQSKVSNGAEKRKRAAADDDSKSQQKKAKKENRE
jgi:hypothetical protein